MKKIIFLAVAAVFVMASCSKNESQGVAKENNAIEFRSVVEKTRASLVDGVDDFTSFFVQAYAADHTDLTGVVALDYMEASVYYNGAAWTYAPTKYYPTNGNEVSFFAYAPVKDVNMGTWTVADGVVSFEYEIVADQSESNTATDLLVSEILEQTAADGDVVFQFNHALSAVTFSAENKNAATTGLVYTIESIELVNLANAGTFTYFDGTDAAAWTNNDTFDQTYVPGINESGIAVLPGAASKKLLSKNDYMMVMPQEPEWAEIENNLPKAGDEDKSYVIITFSLRDGAGEYIYNSYDRHFTLTGFEFEMGKCYNFTFEFDALDAIVLDVADITDWTNTDEPLQ